ncbi:MAG: translation initiation factor IF-2 N-terminal domain-containing protein, partial [Nitrospinota bacterium]
CISQGGGIKCGLMKKIRVYELAKNKGLSNHEVMEMLHKKGLKKVSAITYVDPQILEGSAKSGKPESGGAKVSHLFGKPSASNLAAAREPTLKPVMAEKKAPAAKPAETKKQETKTAAASAEQKKSVKKQPLPPKKERSSVAAIVAMVISVAALAAAGFLYSGLNSSMARVEKLSTDLQASMNRLDQTVTNNRGQLLDLQKDLAGTNQQIDRVKDMTFSSQLKSQSAVLSVIATQLNEPLRAKTRTLADNLAAF